MSLATSEVCQVLYNATTTHTNAARIDTLLPLVIYFVNEYTHNYFAIQAKEEEVAINSSAASQLDHYPVIERSVYITTTDRGTRYYGDAQFGALPLPMYYIPSTYQPDYTISYTTGGLTPTSTNSGGQILDDSTVYVTYAYIDLREGGKVAAIRLIGEDLTRTPGVASESVGSLSRSYQGYTMDNFTKKLLAPYMRVGWA